MFVCENMEGFTTVEGGSRIVELLEPLVLAGYRIHLHKINTAMSRWRVGILNGRGCSVRARR